MAMFSPEGYAKNSSTLDRVNGIFVPKVVNLMSWDFSGGSILDYGCGPGATGYKYILPQVLQTESTMYAMDISPEMVSFAGREWAHPNILYGTGSLPNSCPFPEVLFDKIFSVNVFHLMVDIGDTLGAMVKVLKPGGQLGFTATTAQFPIIKTLDMWQHSDKWAGYLASCQEYFPLWTCYGDKAPEQHFRQVFLEGTGLSEVELGYHTMQVPLKMEVVLDVCLAMNPCLHKVPESMHQELREEYRKMVASILQIPEHTEELVVPLEYVYGVLEKPKDL